jgi:hypothetical protein
MAAAPATAISPRSARRAAALLAAGLLAGCGPSPPRDMSASEVAAELRKVRIEPGLWQVNSRVIDASGPNLPRQARAEMLTHARSERNCITPERAAHPEGNFLVMHRGSRCTHQDFSTDGGRVTGRMRCTGGGLPGVMTTSMDGRHGPTEYDVVMRMESTGMPAGADLTVTWRTLARRIGDCPAASPGRR